ncbi:uncharacterized protein DUF930 [Hoeflea marina]|uniref:Uncharacterized protein DUF930 n=1 Tax=Hoeflea marina TaxID=274592 RepID=A0A317PND0_9HYPH|nr:DUF930 domain-containing protein [Hoeflea marina]PWW02277.1 uncharacterized protein DUF930 [Hoeflea marina]
MPEIGIFDCYLLTPLKLDPATRLEQTCDTEVMRLINREETFNVDKVIAYTFDDTIVRRNAIKAPGAVFRSRGDWYRLSFDCVTGPQHLNARALDYKIGAKIPRSSWQDYYLYD